MGGAHQSPQIQGSDGMAFGICGMGKGVKRQKGKENIPSKIREPQSQVLIPGEGQERLLNPAPLAFELFTMKRSTFWSGFNVSVIQSHRQAGRQIFMKHQTTANLTP